MPLLGVELLSKRIADKLLVRDTIEAPEKFTDEEIGVLKSYRPTDIDYDTRGLPQEAFWYILQDKINGFGCNLRFGKRYVPEFKKYSWYLFVQGTGSGGRYEFEELSEPSDLPMNMEAGVTLLKKYLDKYMMNEEVEELPKEDVKKYKKDVNDLYKLVSGAWNFIHEVNQDYRINDMGDALTKLKKDFPSKSGELRNIEKRLEKIRSVKMQFEDSYYQLKSEINKYNK